MPKPTFEKIPNDKREAFIKGFLEEFAANNYDKASVSVVVKKLNIAKGSVYQYFENKLDLYLYLKTLCETIKMQYVLGIQRSDYVSFWTYYRAQYEAGILFDLEHPLESQFLYRIGEKESSEVLREFMKGWKQQAIQAYIGIIQAEIDQGYFRNDVSAEAMTYFLISVSMGIGDVLRDRYHIDFDENIKDGKPVFALDKTVLMEAVDEQIVLLKGALDFKK
jgi:AcrR family transcriptional regulator